MPHGFTIPFIDHLGIEFVSYGDGQSHLQLEPAPQHHNAYGMAHGGVVMTLLDVTMAFAALEPDVPEVGAVTVEMKTTFLRPGTGTLTGHGRLVHRTSKLVFLEATVYNGEGKPCAQASGTFMLKQRPQPAQEQQDTRQDTPATEGDAWTDALEAPAIPTEFSEPVAAEEPRLPWDPEPLAKERPGAMPEESPETPAEPPSDAPAPSSALSFPRRS